MRSKPFAARQYASSYFQARPFSAFILILLTLAAPTASLAQTQKQQSKPVARLVSSSKQTSPAPRARLVASIPMSEIPATARMETSRRVSSGAVLRPSSAVKSSVASSNAVAGASSLERRAFELVNAERRSRGESPLVWDAQLSQVARQHSFDMARSGNLDHRGPDGRDMAERARAMGVRGWRVLGENIAYNQGFDDPSAFAVERWMGSSKHRANILNSQFTRTGIGVARAADGSIYFTQVFMS
jgi:uncharacterized protein YkwD